MERGRGEGGRGGAGQAQAKGSVGGTRESGRENRDSGGKLYSHQHTVKGSNV